MAIHNELGKLGEDAAVAYLMQNDYIICHRNWRKGHLELDIIATKDDELIVVEVKTRRNTIFMQPEEAVNTLKIRRTVRAANAYIKDYQIDAPVRFDIITVVGKKDNFKINHIKEAFFPPLQ
ncbi:MAG: YraN family protein [Bacteroidaceae bacterium]|nr:YraN family protein [Bacteroidaceae bacterium]